MAAWTLYILVDIPSHRREPWGPRFLWPLAEVALDGVLWVDGLVGLIRKLRRVRQNQPAFLSRLSANGQP